MSIEVPLHEICRPKQWKTISANDLQNDGYPVYGANGKIGFYFRYTHEHPTLMITCRGATCGNVHISQPKSYINGNAMALDDLRKDKVDIRYLYHFLLRRGFSDVISGSAQPQITGQGLTKVLVPLPPLPEQKRIAAILDKADSIRRKRQEAIKLADEFLRSVFLDMFGDPVTNPKGWDLCSLGELIVEGPTNGLYKPSTDYGSGTRILRIDGFYDGAFVAQEKLKRVRVSESEKHRFLLKRRSVVINRVNSREYLGKSCFVSDLTEETLFESNMMNFTVDETKLNPLFLVKLLQTPFSKRQILGRAKDAVNQSSINQQDVKSLNLVLPPVVLQRRFEEISLQVQVVFRSLTTGSSKKENLSASLCSQLLR